jgi:hypothetical protein
VYGRCDVHAGHRLPHRSDVVRDGSFRVRGDGERDERDVVWDQQGVQRRSMQQLHGRRQLHAEQPLRGGRLHLSDRHRDLPGDGNGSRRNDLRHQPGVQRGNLYELHFRSDLFDR